MYIFDYFLYKTEPKQYGWIYIYIQRERVRERGEEKQN